MKKITVITSIFLLLAGIYQYAYCEEVTNPTAPPTPPVLLQYKYAPGEVVRYMVTQKLTGSRTIPGSQTPIPINAELAATLKVECSGIWEDGTIELIVGTETASLKVDGKPVDDYQPSKDTFTVAFSPRGVSGLLVQNFGSLESMLFMTILPLKPVSVGAVWEENFPLPKSWPSRVKLAYALKGINSTNNNSVATIKQNITTTTVSKNGQNVQSTGNLQEGTSEMLFDIISGKLISAKGMVHSVVVTMVGTKSSNGKSNPGDNISKTTLDSAYTVDLIKEQIKSENTAAK